MKKKRAKLPALASIAGALMLLCSCEQPVSSSPGEYVTLNPGAKTEAVTKMDINRETKMQGALVARNTAVLFFDSVSGPLLSINVEPLDRIEEGQVIAEIDANEVQESIDRAGLQKTSWDLRLETQSFNQETAQLTLEQAKETRDYAKKAYDTEPSEAAKEVWDRAKRSVTLAEINLKRVKNERAISKLDYEDFMKGYEKLIASIDNCVLTAPEAGIVTEITGLTIGERATSGAHIARYVPIDNMLLQVPTGAAMNLQGQKDITVTVGDASYRTYTYTPAPGDSVYKSASSALYLAFYGTPPSGMELSQSFPFTLTVEKKGALTVSKRCIRSINGVTTVDVMREGEFVSQIVVCGIDSGDRVEILEGLSEGEQVAAE